MSSRLFQNIRESEGISYSIYSFHSSYSDYGIFGIYCATSPDTYLKALELTMHECKKLVTENVTKEELEDSKNFIIGNLALSLESIEVKMGQLAKNEISYNRHYTFEEIMQNIKNISLDDFKYIGDKLFSNKKFSLISIGKAADVKYNKLDLTF